MNGKCLIIERLIWFYFCFHSNISNAFNRHFAFFPSPVATLFGFVRNQMYCMFNFYHNIWNIVNAVISISVTWTKCHGQMAFHVSPYRGFLLQRFVYLLNKWSETYKSVWKSSIWPLELMRNYTKETSQRRKNITCCRRKNKTRPRIIIIYTLSALNLANR